MKASLQSSASEFVPGEQRGSSSGAEVRASPSLTATLSATPFVPSPKPLGLDAPAFVPGSGLSPGLAPLGDAAAIKQALGTAAQHMQHAQAKKHSGLSSSAAKGAAQLQRSPQAGRGRGRRGAGAPPGPLGATPTAPAASLYIPEALRRELHEASQAAHAQPDASSGALPAFLGPYHTLCVLEDLASAREHASPALGLPSMLLRGVSSRDGTPAALRRLDPRAVPPTPEILAAYRGAQSCWAPLAHQPFLAPWLDVFVSSELDGKPALWLAHAFYPGAATLETAHLAPGGRPATPDLLWDYLVQASAALQAVHAAGLVLWGRCLAPSKVLAMPGTAHGPPRLRVSCAGVLDPLMPGAAPEDVGASIQRRADLAALGFTALTLACAGSGAQPSLASLLQATPPALARVIAGLLASAQGAGYADATELASALAPHALGALSAATERSDALLAELAKETENGRLLRLLARLGTVVGRPRLGADAEWAETGDRYLLKLFYSFLLHQVDETGCPTLDWGVLAESLNKLDAGVAELILLLSDDEASMLAVSYADLKRCYLRCQEDLRRAGQGAGDLGKGHPHRHLPDALQ